MSIYEFEPDPRDYGPEPAHIANGRQLNWYVVALPPSPEQRGFFCPTVLVSAVGELQAIKKARRLKPFDNIGDIKKVT